MNHVISFFSETLVHALGWTLLHSLWQGAFIALLLSLLLVLLHKQSARVRYAVAGAAMLAQLLVAAGTFSYYYSQPLPATLTSVTSSQGAVATTLAAAHTVAPVQTSFWAEPFAVAQLYFEQHMPLLVTLWLLGMVVMAIRFIGGVAYTQRLCHYRTTPLGAGWQQKVNAISRQMGLEKAVCLAESALVQVPMAIGFAKPVILLPIGAVTGLSQAQVEAVLSHELAHILRRDYLVNLLQSVVDMLFFYHPAVWWISGVVRAERENCCDDIAVAVCGDTLTYARALAEIEAMRLPAGPAMSVAFSGQRGSLMSRIKRLVGQQSLKPTFTEGFAAGLVLVAGLLVLSFGAMAALKPQAVQDSTLSQNESSLYEELAQPTGEESASVREGAGAFVYTAQDSTGKSRDIVIIKNKKGKVKELYVDGKHIPNRYIDDYQDLVDQRLQAVENAPRANRQEVAVQIEQARAAAADARQSNRKSYSYHFNYSSGDSLVPPPPAPPAPPAAPGVAPPPPVPPVPPVPPLNEDEEALKEYKQELKRYEAEAKAYEKELKAFEQELKEHEKEVRAYEGELRANGQLNGQHQKELAQQRVEHLREMSRHQAERAQHQAELARQHQKMAQKHQQQFEKVKDELVKDGLIKKGDDNLNIQINNEELYINGKKQSQKIYEKYKKLMNVEDTGSSDSSFQYRSN